MQAKALISVIVCTYSRCESLKDTLESLLTQESDDSFNYEIIVVDNNSNDKTRDVVESYIQKLPNRVRYVFESAQGLSSARNKGVKEAKGEILAFTDDDVIVSPSWLKNIVETFEQYCADCVFGRIKPLCDESVLPVWLRRDRRLWVALSLLDYGDNRRIITNRNESMNGANFALKKEVFTVIKGFRTDLGVNGNKHYIGEETDIFARLLKQGRKIVYAPDATVIHKIPIERRSKKYFFSWYFLGGESLACQFKYDAAGRRFLNVPFWVFKDLIVWIKKLLFACLTFNREDRLRSCLKSVFFLGAAHAFIKQNFQR